MFLRSIAMLAAITLPLFGAPVPKDPPKEAGQVHPYKNAKAGDSATYQMTCTQNGKAIDPWTLTRTVLEVKDNVVTIESSFAVKIGAGKDPDLKIDLAKPLDPLSLGLVSGTDATMLKSGTEKISVGDKEYDCSWTTYSVNHEPVGRPKGEYKIWICKDVVGPVKVIYTGYKGPIAKPILVELTVLLSESSNKAK
jgi:hypothetical protein